jgi:hypothetical protein
VKKLGVRTGVIMGSIMGDDVSEHSSACHKKSCTILWVPTMPGTQILWVPDFFFFLEHSITFCSNLLWVQEDGRRERIVYPVEKIMDAAGIEPVTSR